MARVSLGIGYHWGPSCSSYAALPEPRTSIGFRTASTSRPHSLASPDAPLPAAASGRDPSRKFVQSRQLPLFTNGGMPRRSRSIARVLPCKSAYKPRRC